MNDKIIAELYEAAGIDTKGLAHKIRRRWNKLSYDQRAEYLQRFREHPRRYAHMRWDQLPNNIQAAIVASVKRRQKRERTETSAT